jgi:uncharacterized protein (TIGR03086 family)
MDLSELHRRAVEEWEARVVLLREADWSLSTPCPEWDVHALVNHIVAEDLWTGPIVDGATIEEVGDRFAGDLLGDPSEAISVAVAAATEAVRAVRRRLPDHPVVHLSFGDVAIEEYVWQLSADHLVHAWDLAAATGRDRTLAPALVDAVADWYLDREQMYRDAGVVGERRSGGADPQSRLIAAFGRDPGWQP